MFVYLGLLYKIYHTADICLSVRVCVPFRRLTDWPKNARLNRKFNCCVNLNNQILKNVLSLLLGLRVIYLGYAFLRFDKMLINEHDDDDECCLFTLS